MKGYVYTVVASLIIVGGVRGAQTSGEPSVRDSRVMNASFVYAADARLERKNHAASQNGSIATNLIALCRGQSSFIILNRELAHVISFFILTPSAEDQVWAERELIDKDEKMLREQLAQLWILLEDDTKDLAEKISVFKRMRALVFAIKNADIFKPYFGRMSYISSGFDELLLDFGAINFDYWAVFVTDEGNAVLVPPSYVSLLSDEHESALYFSHMTRITSPENAVYLTAPDKESRELISNQYARLFVPYNPENPLVWNVFFMGHGLNPIQSCCVSAGSSLVVEGRAPSCEPCEQSGALLMGALKPSTPELIKTKAIAFVCGMPIDSFLYTINALSVRARVNTLSYSTCFGGGYAAHAIAQWLDFVSKRTSGYYPLVLSMTTWDVPTVAKSDADFAAFFHALPLLDSPKVIDPAAQVALMSALAHISDESLPLAIVPGDSRVRCESLGAKKEMTAGVHFERDPRRSNVFCVFERPCVHGVIRLNEPVRFSSQTPGRTTHYIDRVELDEALTIDEFFAYAATKATSIYRKSFVIKELVGRVGDKKIVPEVADGTRVTLQNVVIMLRPFHVFEFVGSVGVVAFISQSGGTHWFTHAVGNIGVRMEDISHTSMLSRAAAQRALVGSILEEIALSDLKEAQYRGGKITIDAEHLSPEVLLIITRACVMVDPDGCGLQLIRYALDKPDILPNDRDRLIKELIQSKISSAHVVAIVRALAVPDLLRNIGVIASKLSRDELASLLHGVSGAQLLRSVIESAVGMPSSLLAVLMESDWNAAMLFALLEAPGRDEDTVVANINQLYDFFYCIAPQELVGFLERLIMASKMKAARAVVRYMRSVNRKSYIYSDRFARFMSDTVRDYYERVIDDMRYDS